MTVDRPTFEYEEALWQRGSLYVAGIDEVGRGALAGPVVAAAVIVPAFSQLEGVWCQVRDSKQLSALRRQVLEKEIQQQALAWAIGKVEAEIIDQVGIAEATRRAMLEAIARLAVQPDHLLIDWVNLSQAGIAQHSMPKADARIASVAAASILAKVYRDRLMCEADLCYPDYGFAKHKGYGSAAHLAAIEQHGPSPIHRRSFAPLLQLKLF
ncbi:MAG: ribonuclease HII [Caldilineaceae bacterium]